MKTQCNVDNARKLSLALSVVKECRGTIIALYNPPEELAYEPTDDRIPVSPEIISYMIDLVSSMKREINAAHDICHNVSMYKGEWPHGVEKLLDDQADFKWKGFDVDAASMSLYRAHGSAKLLSLALESKEPTISMEVIYEVLSDIGGRLDEALFMIETGITNAQPEKQVMAGAA